MKNRFFLLAFLLCILGAASAQDDKQVYLVKGSKIVGTYSRSDVDYITFNKPSDASQSEYRITPVNGEIYEFNCPKTAERGQDVLFSVYMDDNTKRPAKVYANDQECTRIGDDGVTWYYTFSMPAKDVTLTLTTEQNMHVITLKQGAHTTITMLNSSDDWEKDSADRVFDNFAGEPVKFLWNAHLGYEGTLKVYTASGTDVACEYVTDDEDYGECWKCFMPNERLIIETIATEKTDYLGQPFVGDYKGYGITVGAQGVVSGTTPEFALSLNSNSSFLAKSTDTNAFNFDGCYTYDATKNTFAYIAEYSSDAYGEKDYGVSGTWFTANDALVSVSDLQNDKPDNMKYYFVSKSDFTYAAAASDAYGSRFLIEMHTTDGNRYYYFSKIDNTVQQVTLDYTSGTSVTDASSAMVYDLSGTPLFRYTRATASSQPVFTLKGAEAGTYTKQNGTSSDATLTLDGFGNATYGTTTGTYTIDKSIVSFTSAGSADKQTFIIDQSAMTYTVNASSVWDGSESFAALIVGRYDDNTASSGMFALTLNHDYAGNEKEGAVKVQVTLTDSYYDTKSIIASTASYTYDAAAQTITVTGILVGTADGRSTERTSVVFNVSADKKSLTCSEDKLLRAPSGGTTRYISVKDVILTARD